MKKILFYAAARLFDGGLCSNAPLVAFAVTSALSLHAAPTPENTPDCFVEWVQAKGDVYIDTGVVGKVGTKSEIFFGNAPNTWADVMLGSFLEDTVQKRIHLCGFHYAEVKLQYGTTYNQGAYGSVPYGGDYMVETEFAADGTLTGKTTKADGTFNTATVNWSETQGLIDTGISMYLFANHRVNPASNVDRAEGFHRGRLYSARIWQTNGVDAANYVLVRDYRPCVKNGIAGVYDAVSETIFYPAQNSFRFGPAIPDGWAAAAKIGAIEHPATQWGVIRYGNRSAMSDAMWKFISLGEYTSMGEGDINNLNDFGPNSAAGTWIDNNAQKAQLRFDGWFYVSAEKSGEWSINQKYDNYFAFYIDNKNVLYNNTYNKECNATVSVTEGWHRFTIIAGDTNGGYGSNKDYGTGFGRLPFRVTVGGAAYAFNTENFPQGSGLNRVTLDADADWSDRGTILLNSGTVLDLNGYKLTVRDVVCDDYIGAMVTNSAEKKATLLFSDDPFESAAYAHGLIKDVGGGILLAKTGERTAVWTGAANDGGIASNPDNWLDAQRGEPIVPTADYSVSIFGAGINVQIPVGSTFDCKAFEIRDCTLSSDCDWSGLAVSPMIFGTADLAGHVLTMKRLTAVPGATFSGGDGSSVRFIPGESASIATLSEATFIDDIANLSLAGSAKILIAKKEGDSTLAVNNMQLGTLSTTEMSQTGGTVNFGNTVNKIGANKGMTGIYRITGGTLTAGTDSEFVVGANGRGEVIQTGGDVKLGNWFSIGRFEDGNGTYTITGGTLTAVKNGRPLWISGEQNSTGTFNVSGDAVVALDSIKMCAQNKSGMNAFLNVSGNGELNVNYYLRTSEGNGTSLPRNAEINQSGGKISVGVGKTSGNDINLGGDCGTAKFVQSAGILTADGTIFVGDGRKKQCTATMDVGGTVNAGNGIIVGSKATATGTLTLRKGGELNVASIRKGAGKGSVVLDGGKITAKQTNGGFISGIDSIEFTTNTVVIDSAGYDIGIANTTYLYPQKPGSGIVKTGSGTLTFASLPEVDSIVVSDGTLALESSCDNAVSAAMDRTMEIASGATLAIGEGNTLRQPVLGAGGTLSSGSLIVTERVNATAGRTMTIGKGATIDLTKAEISVVNPSGLTENGWTLVSSPSGGIVPDSPRRIADVEGGYLLFLSENEARIGKNGFSVIVR